MSESHKYTILFVDDARPSTGKMAVNILTNPKINFDLLNFLKPNSKIINPVTNTEITEVNVLWATNCYDAISQYIDNKNLVKINLILMDFDLSEYGITDIQRANTDPEIKKYDENEAFCKNIDTIDEVDVNKMKDENNGCNTARYIRGLGYKGPIIPVSTNNSYFGLFKKQICGNWFVENENDIHTHKVNTNNFFGFLTTQLTKYYKIDKTISYLESIDANNDDKTPMLDLSGNPQSSVSIKQNILPLPSPSPKPKPSPSPKPKSFFRVSNKIGLIDTQQLLKTPSVKLAADYIGPVINKHPTVKVGTNIYKQIQKDYKQIQKDSIRIKPRAKGGKKTKKLHKKQRKTKKRILGRRRKTNRIK